MASLIGLVILYWMRWLHLHVGWSVLASGVRVSSPPRPSAVEHNNAQAREPADDNRGAAVGTPDYTRRKALW